jgi:hypothetical protein
VSTVTEVPVSVTVIAVTISDEAPVLPVLPFSYGGSGTISLDSRAVPYAIGSG